MQSDAPIVADPESGGSLMNSVGSNPRRSARARVGSESDAIRAVLRPT
jgi:hypothetical protein